MNLVIDAGNTRLKAGVFLSGRLTETWEGNYRDDFPVFLAGKKPRGVIVNSANRQYKEILNYINNDATVLELTPRTQLPIVSAYNSPETLRMDRIATIIGAFAKFPEKSVLVINLGTCITYDFLTKDMVYLGGGISPGIHMRFKAMQQFTNVSPSTNINVNTSTDLVGKDIIDCMQSGVFHGIRLELEGIIREYHEKFGQIKVIFCGRDAFFFESSVKATIFVDKHLTLKGLNKILEAN
ncbi:MAG: type III pantothenate kinase [Bacteroidota bacterium]